MMRKVKNKFNKPIILNRNLYKLPNIKIDFKISFCKIKKINIYLSKNNNILITMDFLLKEVNLKIVLDHTLNRLVNILILLKNFRK